MNRRYSLFKIFTQGLRNKSFTRNFSIKSPIQNNLSKNISSDEFKYFIQNKRNKFNFNLETVKNGDDLNKAYEEYKSLIKKLEEKSKIICKSCGIGPLQSKDNSTENYYQIPTISLELPKQKNLGIPKETELEMLKELKIDDDDDNENNDFKELVSAYDVALEQKAKKLAELANMKVECLRCHQLKNHGVFNINGYKVEEIMDKIPINATIVNVISIYDFPLSCDSKILKGRDPKNIYYAVTKADLFYRKDSQINKTGLNYVKDVLVSYMNADPEKVFFVSSLKSWNLKNMISDLPPGKLYIVGRANSGKSSLIKSLIASYHDINISNNIVKNLEKKNKNYLETVGLDSPGTFHIPGYTREFQKFKIGEKFTIFDTPGFFPSGKNIYDHMTPEIIRKPPKYGLFVAEDRRRLTKLSIKGPKIFNGSALYSYGGFFYLQPPKGLIMKRAIAFNRGERKFEARYPKFKRAEEINETRPKQIGNRYGVKPSAFYELERYVIPPFYGNIDIVIQDLGFLTIAPTTAPDAVKGLFQIWVPKGIRVIVRESIFKFVYKTHDVIDETGNVLKKQNIARRGATVLKSVLDEEKLHFTELIPVEANISNDEAFLKVCPPEDMVSVDDSNAIKSQSDYKNQYWRRINL
jgi:ribosome biogenesis GTPase A